MKSHNSENANLSLLIDGLQIENNSLRTDLLENKKLNNLLLTTLDTISDSICLIDSDGEILYHNKATEILLNKKTKEIKGFKCYEVVHNASEPITNCPINKIKISKQKESLVYQQNNKWFEVSAEPIKSNNGEYAGVAHIIKDVTEQKQNADALILAKEKAEESDKLKTAFLQNISHEIRTPMNGIMGFSELLLKPGLEEKKKKLFIDIIHNNCLDLLGIINDIIDISKIELGQVSLHETEFNLNQLLIDIEQFFLHSARMRNLSLLLKTNMSNNDSFIFADEVKIKQILNNLINNALKFTKNGSVEFGYNVIDNKLEFFVKDSGIGIPKEKFDEIFERFRQVPNELKESRTGTGLGLSISKALVKIMKGDISLKSELNKGTTFNFTIPYKQINKEQNNRLKDINTIKDYTGKTILIAEDDDVNMKFLIEILEQSKAKIINAQNGKEAIDFCLNYPEIDLVLMDIKMPVVDGIDATLEIRKHRKSLPIIAQTANAFSVDMNRAFEVGCNDYISKPIVKDILLNKIDKLIFENY